MTRAEGLLAMELRSMPHSRARVLETAEVPLIGGLGPTGSEFQGWNQTSKPFHSWEKNLLPKQVGN